MLKKPSKIDMMDVIIDSIGGTTNDRVPTRRNHRMVPPSPSYVSDSSPCPGGGGRPKSLDSQNVNPNSEMYRAHYYKKKF